jgi:hypothetical protein
MLGEQMKISYGIRKLGNLTRPLGVIRTLAVVFALALLCGAAKADTVETYDVSGVFASGGTLTGEFTFDYSAYSGGVNPITSVDITADGVNFTNCPGGPAGTCNLYDNLAGSNDGFGVAFASGYPYLNIVWQGVDLTNPPYTLTLSSSTLCVDCGANGVPAFGGYYDNLVSGIAVDPPGPVATPENGTLTMLLAGLLGLGLFAAWQSTRGKFAGQQI